MADSAFDIIRQAIDEYPGSKKANGPSMFVQCPFHDESTPSCSVVLSEDHDVPIGSFYCFGCGEHGSWNYFASKASLPEIKGWKFFKGGMSQVISREDEVKMLGTDYSTASKLKSKATIPWPRHLKWRGYDGILLNRLHAESYNDKATDEPMVVFPVVVNKRTRGAVRAFMHKKEGRSSYLTTEGSWIKTYGLFPYDYTKAFIKKYKLDFVVLVEGPRDCLRLISMGIPALAVLGSQSITQKKLLMVRSLIGDNGQVYVMSDNDTAGKKMAKVIKNTLLDLGGAERLLMPEETDKKGKKKKYDPDNCPDWYMKRIRKWLRETHAPYRKVKKEVLRNGY